MFVPHPSRQTDIPQFVDLPQGLQRHVWMRYPATCLRLATWCEQLYMSNLSLLACKALVEDSVDRNNNHFLLQNFYMVYWKLFCLKNKSVVLMVFLILAGLMKKLNNGQTEVWGQCKWNRLDASVAHVCCWNVASVLKFGPWSYIWLISI